VTLLPPSDAGDVQTALNLPHRPGVYIPVGAVDPSQMQAAYDDLTHLQDDFDRDELAVSRGELTGDDLSNDLRRDADTLRPLLTGPVIVESERARFIIAPDHQSLTAP
jgi:hypothetical protein